MDDDLELPDGDLPDDDAAVINGMNRLHELRKHENDIRDLPRRPE